MEPLEREIRLSGLRFHYVEWGTAAAPPLVLLHGFTGHARTWDDFAASVAACFRVLALAPRGPGHAGRAPLACAASRGGRVERLVLGDIGPEIAPEGAARVRTVVANVPEELASEEQACRLLRAASPRYSDSLIRHRVKHGFNRLPGGRLGWKYDKALRIQAREGRRDMPDLWPAPARTARPALIVRGIESDVLSP